MLPIDNSYDVPMLVDGCRGANESELSMRPFEEE
jgi:hypothetical protein